MKTHILCSMTFFRKARQCGKIWYSQAGYRWQYNTAHALCVLNKLGHRHKLRICNTYCFSTATVVTRTRLNVTCYAHCLSCLRFTPVLSTKHKDSIDRRHKLSNVSQYCWGIGADLRSN